MNSILLVEDKESLAVMLQDALQAEGFSVDWARDGREASRKLQEENLYTTVLTDLRLPVRDGIEVLRESKHVDPDCPVIVMTAFGTIEQAVEAMRLGAYDFIQKPIDIDHLVLLLKRCQEHRLLKSENILLRDELRKRFGVPTIIGESLAIREVTQQIQRVSATDSAVLLLGESGTGKELFARAVHQLSARRDRPFVAVNCAAIPESLLENELFGHEKGAYTGAGSRQIGKFELADSGTIFLDEIGELGISVQSKLLRVLQEKTIERLGGNRLLHVNVRVICATNRSLQEAIRDGRFREDLFYRINVFPVTIPPLRARREDLRPLVAFFLQRFRSELAKPSLEIAPDALERLFAYDWPGNVRELENCIERAAIVCDDGVIRAGDLAIGASRDADRLRECFDLSGSLSQAAQRAAELAERVKIEDVIRKEPNRQKAAELLGVNYRTLLGKLKQYNLSEEEERK